MEFIASQDLEELKKDTFGFLLKNEADHTMVFDLINKIEEGSMPIHHLFWIKSEKDILLVAIYCQGIFTRFAFSHCTEPEKTFAFFAKNLASFISSHENLKDIPAGIFITNEYFETFHNIWKNYEISRIENMNLKMKQFFYTMDQNEFKPIQDIKNEMIIASEKESEICHQFYTEFMEELFNFKPQKSASDTFIKAKRFYLLKNPENYEFISMGIKAGVSPTSARLGFIYTPRIYRKKGYASELLSLICSMLFKQGLTSLCLYTDQKNPTSNKIYQNIGFRKIRECGMYEYNLKK